MRHFSRTSPSKRSLRVSPAILMSWSSSCATVQYCPNRPLEDRSRLILAEHKSLRGRIVILLLQCCECLSWGTLLRGAESPVGGGTFSEVASVIIVPSINDGNSYGAYPSFHRSLSILPQWPGRDGGIRTLDQLDISQPLYTAELHPVVHV